MSRAKKRFLIPLFFVIAFVIYAVVVPTNSDYSDLLGGITAFFVFIDLPLAIISLIWAIVGACKDHKLKKAGLPVDNHLFSDIKKPHKKTDKDREDFDEDAHLTRKQLEFKYAFRMLASICFAAGVLGVVSSRVIFIVIGALLIVAGAVLFFFSSPRSSEEAAATDNVDAPVSEEPADDSAASRDTLS